MNISTDVEVNELPLYLDKKRTTVVLAIIVLGCILALAVYAWFMDIFPRTTTNQDNSDMAALVEQVNSWSTSFLPVEGTRGVCSEYATYTADVDVVDKMEGVEINALSQEATCLNGQNAILQKVSRTCSAATGKRCRGVDGKLYSRGEQEEYYRTCDGYDYCSQKTSTVVVAQNFEMVNEEISSGAFCVGQTTGVSCATTTKEDLYLTLSESTPATTTINGEDVSIPSVRIMKLGTVECLQATNPVSFVLCSTLPDNGFVWGKTPNVEYESTLIPQQLVSLNTIASGVFANMRSLHIYNGGLSLAPLVTCSTSSQCVEKTSILSSLDWARW